MERVLEFQKWIGNCVRDGKKQLNLKPLEICYVLACSIVKELLREIGKNEHN